MLRQLSSLVLALLLMCSAAGCATGGQTGAVAGTGIGALAGQAIGRNTTGTLIGAGVGAGVGYIIGNEADKKKAQEMSAASYTSAGAPTNTEVGSLGGTRWQVVSLNPPHVARPYRYKIVEFRRDGRVITTTTNHNGTIEIADEGYRVVGDTLVVNQANYLINARFRIAGNELIINDQNFSAVLRRY